MYYILLHVMDVKNGQLRRKIKTSYQGDVVVEEDD